MENQSILQVIQSYGIQPKKSLGQNFILDMHVTDRIIHNMGDLSGKCVLEIGAGPGCLTRSILASKARRVIAVETDERCIGALTKLQEQHIDRLEIIQADALTIDERMFGEDKLTIIANLPYNIGTALVLKWLGAPAIFDSINIMLQKEVVDRICAAPRSDGYGRLSVICQWLCEAYELMQIEPENFYPAPKVMSSVVRLVPLAQPRFECEKKLLEKVTQLAFAGRRKMLRSSLKSLFSEAEMQALGIKSTKRAEELTLSEFCSLARALVDETK